MEGKKLNANEKNLSDGSFSTNFWNMLKRKLKSSVNNFI